MKITIEFLFGVVFITVLTSLMFAQVGLQSECSTEANTFTLPLTAFIISAIPFVLGFVAGKNQ